MTLVNPPQACACWISIKESTAQTLNGTGIFTYIDPIKRLAIHVGKYPPQLMVWGPVVWDSKDPRKWKGLGFLGSTGNIPNEKKSPYLGHLHVDIIPQAPGAPKWQLLINKHVTNIFVWWEGLKDLWRHTYIYTPYRCFVFMTCCFWHPADSAPL